jgi:molecular chaperone GrpE
MEARTMTDPNGHSTDPQATAEAAAASSADPAALAKEAADYKDRLLRTLAEMENLRRRTEREVADSRQYAVANFARDLLAVADNMQRALDTLSADFRDQADPVVKSHIEGVELTERELVKVMEKHGIKRFDPQGQKFDPNLHQAMMQVPDPSVPDGTVVQVMQPGYMIAERVLRPALVGVSKGGPKAAPAAHENAAANSVDTQA